MMSGNRGRLGEPANHKATSRRRRTTSTPGLNERISVEEALRVNTIFVVLSGDPFTVDKGKIKDIQIVRTVVGGTTVYQA